LAFVGRREAMRIASAVAPASRVALAPSRGFAPSRAAVRRMDVFRAAPHESPALEAVASPHPDAIRRRNAAEARQRERLLEKEETQRSLRGEPGTSLPSNMLQVNTPAEFEFHIHSSSQNGQLVLVHFKGRWCPACARMQHKLKRTAEQNEDVFFIVVDLSDEDLSKHCSGLGVENIPYFHLYKNNELVSRFSCNLGNIGVLRRELAAHRGDDESVWANLANAVPAPSALIY